MARQPNPGNARKEKKDKAKDRISNGSARLKNRRPEATADYLKYGEFGIEEVRCKLCSSVIKRLAVVPDLERVERRGTQTIVTQPVVLKELANYTEVLMEMDDGSAHVTPMCIECAKSVQAEDLEDMYEIDMGQASKDEELGLGEVYWESWADRKPKGSKKLRG